VVTADGSSVVETERLLLHVNEPEKAAFIWSKAPILTNDFEVIMHLRVTGDKDISNVVKDQSFALWYVYENVSAAFTNEKLSAAPKRSDGSFAPSDLGMGFVSSKPKFKGLGAVFSMVDGKDTPKAVVSGIWNNGDRELAYGAGKDVPTPDAKAIDFRNTLNAAMFRLRVTPTSITGELKQSKSLSWNECFSINRTESPVETGGYLGITAWSGSTSPPSTSDQIAITQLEVSNFDSTSIGEEMTDVSMAIQEAYREMLTDEKRHFVDQKSQTDHLKRLEDMLAEHLNTTKPADQKMFQELEGLQDRVKQLDEKCSTLTKSLQVVVDGENNSDSGSTVLTQEIIGLRRLLTKDNEEHRQLFDKVGKKMEKLQQHKKETGEKVQKVKILAKEQRDLDEQIGTRGRRNMRLWILIISFCGVFGYVLFTQFQKYEKRTFSSLPP